MPSTTGPITEALLRRLLGRLLRPGDRIVWGQCAGEPLSLSEAVVAQAAQLGPWSVFVGATFSDTLPSVDTPDLVVSSYGLGVTTACWYSPDRLYV